MKNIFKYSALLACLAIIGLVSCTQEELSTDQYDDGIVTLAAFGPNPVVRGDTLTILGSNLEKVKEVQLPGVDPITEFAEVVPGAKGHIKVLVPVEGPEDAPVSGLVSIVDENGTVFSSTTELSYTEGIKIASFSPAEALPGDIVTIKGEYLYNVREVVFVSGNAKGKTYVTGDAITASRYELKVAVPADAISGLIMLADVDEIADPDALPNTTYTATEITIKDPEVTAFAQKTFKAGDKVDITGAYLNMMQTVKFAGADVDVADFTVSADGKKLTVTLPAAANDGAVTAVSYAGKEFPAGEIVTVRPTELAVAAESRFKAGLNVFVSGKDLDLVTGVKVSGIDATFTTTAAKTTVVLPAESADGDVVLSLANGNTVTAGNVEVVKPVIESLSVTSVVAGETLVVKGTDLDLVTEVAISGQMCEFELEGNDLKVYVSKAAYTGDLVVTAANKAQSASPIEVTYKESVNIEYVKASISLGGTLQLTGASLMQIESITIKGVKVGEYLSRTDTELSFVLPEDIKSPGIYNLDLVLISGETLTWAVPFEVTAPFTESFIWEGSENLVDNALAVFLAKLIMVVVIHKVKAVVTELFCNGKKLCLHLFNRHVGEAEAAKTNVTAVENSVVFHYLVKLLDKVCLGNVGQGAGKAVFVKLFLQPSGIVRANTRNLYRLVANICNARQGLGQALGGFAKLVSRVKLCAKLHHNYKSFRYVKIGL